MDTMRPLVAKYALGYAGYLNEQAFRMNTGVLPPPKSVPTDDLAVGPSPGVVVPKAVEDVQTAADLGK